MEYLNESACAIVDEGVSRRVIDDAPLLSWAAARGCSPADAQHAALDLGILPLRYLRNQWALTHAEQRMLCAGTVLVCGCGGLGGILVQLLARVGVGHLRLVDGDVFAPSNLNRQLLCDTANLARPKVEAAVETVRAVNPLVDVAGWQEELTEDNSERIMAGADLVLDALDNLAARFLLETTARRLQVPFVHAAVAGWWGQVSTFYPEGPWRLRHIFGERRARERGEASAGVLGATTAALGSLQALEAVRLLCGRAPAYAGRLLYLDGESGAVEVFPLEDLTS
jgi:molybdopterin/thiamine biosynthesis adenylyltransferase